MPNQPTKRVLKASGRSVAHIWFDTERTRAMRREKREHIAYHIDGLLLGEGTAAMEWEHFGIAIEVEEDTDGG